MLRVPSDQARLNSTVTLPSQQVQALISQRRSQDVTAQDFLPLLIVRHNAAGGVQVERAVRENAAGQEFLQLLGDVLGQTITAIRIDPHPLEAGKCRWKTW
jgi:hypothetical protein